MHLNSGKNTYAINLNKDSGVKYGLWEERMHNMKRNLPCQKISAAGMSWKFVDRE